MEALDLAIRARTLEAARRSMKPDDDPEETASHLAFIDMLERVQDVLNTAYIPQQEVVGMPKLKVSLKELHSMRESILSYPRQIRARQCSDKPAASLYNLGSRRAHDEALL